jgi:sirohydrochlorin cobaltochelatase
MKAVLLVSHGSRISKTKAEVERLVKELKAATGLPLIAYAFLEIESPSIPEGIAFCVQQGATEIIVLLNFLNSGRHVDEDIPGIIEEERKEFPRVAMSISSPVGQHPGIVSLFAAMIAEGGPR